MNKKIINFLKTKDFSPFLVNKKFNKVFISRGFINSESFILDDLNNLKVKPSNSILNKDFYLNKKNIGFPFNFNTFIFKSVVYKNFFFKQEESFFFYNYKNLLLEFNKILFCLSLVKKLKIRYYKKYQKKFNFLLLKPIKGGFLGFFYGALGFLSNNQFRYIVRYIYVKVLLINTVLEKHFLLYYLNIKNFKIKFPLVFVKFKIFPFSLKKKFVLQPRRFKFNFSKFYKIYNNQLIFIFKDKNMYEETKLLKTHPTHKKIVKR